MQGSAPSMLCPDVGTPWWVVSEDAKFSTATMESLNNLNKTQQSRKRTCHKSDDVQKIARVSLPCNGRDCKQQLSQYFFCDCSGNQYRKIPMRGNGFCGFNSLSYSLTGNQQSYEDIINDCVNVFVNVPDLFRLRTNFGARHDSSLSVSDYVTYMHAAVERVRRSLSVDSDAWCEDAHLAAIAILYDIAIFNYSTAAHQ